MERVSGLACHDWWRHVDLVMSNLEYCARHAGCTNCTLLLESVLGFGRHYSELVCESRFHCSWSLRPRATCWPWRYLKSKQQFCPLTTAAPVTLPNRYPSMYLPLRRQLCSWVPKHPALEVCFVNLHIHWYWIRLDICWVCRCSAHVTLDTASQYPRHAKRIQRGRSCCCDWWQWLGPAAWFRYWHLLSMLVISG
jgi:hypothetical protein